MSQTKFSQKFPLFDVEKKYVSFTVTLGMPA
jgi:hypothetical protein